MIILLIKLGIIFCLIFCYKLISNVFNLIKLTYYKKHFINFLNGKSNNALQHKNQLIYLFKNANVEDVFFTISHLTGYGFVQHSDVSVFGNYPSKELRFSKTINKKFENALGVYKSRIFECFNPIYWIICVIFLPKSILSYLGISAESIFIKILQIAYWAITFLFTLFSSEITTWIKSFIQSL